jgi:serine/threonine protein kinase
MVKKIGRYELGRTLGVGRFGKVKFAMNTETSQTVAVKIMEKNRIVELNSVERVKREIAIMKSLHHPNVVELVEVSRPPSHPPPPFSFSPFLFLFLFPLHCCGEGGLCFQRIKFSIS